MGFALNAAAIWASEFAMTATLVVPAHSHWQPMPFSVIENEGLATVFRDHRHCGNRVGGGEGGERNKPKKGGTRVPKALSCRDGQSASIRIDHSYCHLSVYRNSESRISSNAG